MDIPQRLNDLHLHMTIFLKRIKTKGHRSSPNALYQTKSGHLSPTRNKK